MWLGRLHKLKDTLTTVRQLEQSMQRLRQWLIETEHEMSMPLVFQHCDFAELEEHVNRQQVTGLFRIPLLNVIITIIVIIIIKYDKS